MIYFQTKHLDMANPLKSPKLITLETDSYGRPDELVNGILGLIAYSEYMANPWMRLDLQDSYYIREVIIMSGAWYSSLDFAIRIGKPFVFVFPN